MSRKIVIVLFVWCVLPLSHALLPGCFFSAVSLVAQTEGAAPADDFWEKLRALFKKKEVMGNQRESVIDKYEGYYDWIHQEEYTLYDSLRQQGGVVDWDKYQNIIVQKTSDAKDSTLSNNLATNIKVFGWYPYWMGSAYKSFRFNLLSYVAWFSYNLDPATGNCTNPDVLAMWSGARDFIDSAHMHQCKVLLTVTSHNRFGNSSFLQNPAAQAVLIHNLVEAVKKNGADGIDVNFENIPDGLEAELTRFLRNLSDQLKKDVPRSTISVDLPIVDTYKNYQLARLDTFIDLFLVTGYDYYNIRSKTDGPVAPLDVRSGPYSIKQSVNQYLKTGLRREKLILGLPYYGAIWSAQSKIAGQPDSTLRFQRHITYRELKVLYCAEKPYYDSISWSGYYTRFNQDSNYYERCWFDDSLTMARKMDWILEENLAGMGIWALGYDNGYPEFWSLIGKKFAGSKTLVYREPNIKSRYYDLSRSLLEYRPLIAIAGIFMVVFLLAGLLVALFDWRVREVFFQNRTLRLLYAVGGIAIILAITAFFLYVEEKPALISKNRSLLALGIGLVLGVSLTLYISHRYEQKIKELP